jgi:hypothetical protein
VDFGGTLLRGYSDDQILESAIAFLMRLLFILKTEETGLLPHGTVAYDRAYGVLHLLTRLENANRLGPEKLRTSNEAYSQLLATFRVVYSGSPDPDIHVAPFLGGLFDPDRYPLLEGRQRGHWANLAILKRCLSVIRSFAKSCVLSSTHVARVALFSG